MSFVMWWRFLMLPAETWLPKKSGATRDCPAYTDVPSRWVLCRVEPHLECPQHCSHASSNRRLKQCQCHRCSGQYAQWLIGYDCTDRQCADTELQQLSKLQALAGREVLRQHWQSRPQPCKCQWHPQDCIDPKYLAWCSHLQLHLDLCFTHSWRNCFVCSSNEQRYLCTWEACRIVFGDLRHGSWSCHFQQRSFGVLEFPAHLPGHLVSQLFHCDIAHKSLIYCDFLRFHFDFSDVSDFSWLMFASHWFHCAVFQRVAALAAMIPTVLQKKCCIHLAVATSLCIFSSSCCPSVCESRLLDCARFCKKNTQLQNHKASGHWWGSVIGGRAKAGETRNDSEWFSSRVYICVFEPPACPI